MLMLLWIIIGLVAGWLTGRLMKNFGFGNNWGLWLDSVIGLAGGVMGGFTMRSSAFIDEGGTIYTILMALLGAVVLTVLNGLVGGRRRYA
jgi:uncharacterized membrane protein YeaQ/YmgE (transglycosylase-associated protein family)